MWKHSRRINTTTADGNCLFRSLSKGLLGTEKYHYRVRTTLFGFIFGNANIFLPHIQQKYKCTVKLKEYCLSMDTSGVWGTEIELRAAATLLQAPVYTYTQMGSTKSYRWSRFCPLSPPSKVVCDYDAKSLFICPSHLTITLNCFTLVGVTMTLLCHYTKIID